MPVFQLTSDLIFPDPKWAEPDGLLAVGGDLCKERLLLAYKMGIFPWYMKEPILWFSPDPRFVLFPEKIRVSRSLRKKLNQNIFQVTFNKSFEEVIRACADSHFHKGTWITNEMIKAYTELSHSNIAKSIEVWKDNKLVGGLYGVFIGKVFCGESMFHLERDASKIALVYLAERAGKIGIELIDSQVYTEHMEKMGAEFISRREYNKFLEIT